MLAGRVTVRATCIRPTVLSRLLTALVATAAVATRSRGAAARLQQHPAQWGTEHEHRAVLTRWLRCAVLTQREHHAVLTRWLRCAVLTQREHQAVTGRPRL
jgi:hypothetical protein